MRGNSKANCEKAAAEFEAAAKVASNHGMVLRSMSFADRPNDAVQYRIEGPNNAWFKEIHPLNQRIYCPNKSKQGPFVAMQYGKHWTLMDVVQACVRAVEKAKREAKPAATEVITGPTDTRIMLSKLISSVAKMEGTGLQESLRDVLTDIRHVVDFLKLDINLALDGSYEVYLEEKADPELDLQGTLIASRQEEKR